MAQTNINIRIDDTLKQQFDHLCGELGLTMTTAFNIFAKTMVRRQGMPFKVSLNVSDFETLATINDVNHGKNLSKAFHTVVEFMEDLNTCSPLFIKI